MTLFARVQSAATEGRSAILALEAELAAMNPPPPQSVLDKVAALHTRSWFHLSRIAPHLGTTPSILSGGDKPPADADDGPQP